MDSLVIVLQVGNSHKQIQKKKFMHKSLQKCKQNGGKPIMPNLVKGIYDAEWNRDLETTPDACLSLLPQGMLVVSQFQSENHYKKGRTKTLRNFLSSKSYEQQRIRQLVPVTTVQSHLIQGKGVAAALKTIG